MNYKGRLKGSSYRDGEPSVTLAREPTRLPTVPHHGTIAVKKVAMQHDGSRCKCDRWPGPVYRHSSLEGQQPCWPSTNREQLLRRSPVGNYAGRGPSEYRMFTALRFPGMAEVEVDGFQVIAVFPLVEGVLVGKVVLVDCGNRAKTGRQSADPQDSRT